MQRKVSRFKRILAATVSYLVKKIICCLSEAPLHCASESLHFVLNSLSQGYSSSILFFIINPCNSFLTDALISEIQIVKHY